MQRLRDGGEVTDEEWEAGPIEHWYLTVAERIGDLPDYDY